MVECHCEQNECPSRSSRSFLFHNWDYLGDLHFHSQSSNTNKASIIIQVTSSSTKRLIFLSYCSFTSIFRVVYRASRWHVKQTIKKTFQSPTADHSREVKRMAQNQNPRHPKYPRLHRHPSNPESKPRNPSL